MPYPVNIDLNNPQDDVQRLFDIKKLPLTQAIGVPASQPTRFKEDSAAQMLARLKPEYKLFDNQPFDGSCSTDTCLNPREIAVMRMCLKPHSQTQRQVQQ